MTAQQTLFETADPDRKPRPARQTAGQVKAVARSLDRLRRSGYVAEVVERFVTFGGPTDVQKTVDDLLRDRGALIAFLEEVYTGGRQLSDGGFGVRMDAAAYRRLSRLVATREPIDRPGRVGYRKDLFGVVDILAFEPDKPGVLAVQATSRPQIAAHLAQYQQNDDTRDFLKRWFAARGRRFEIHGWQKWLIPTKPGAAADWKARWVAEVRVVTPDDLIEERF